MQIHQVTVGPIVGATTEKTVRIWGRGQFEATPSGPRRCFGIIRLWPADQAPGSDPKYFKMNPNFDMTGIIIYDKLQQETKYKYQMGWFFSDLELEEVNKTQLLEPDWENIPVHEFTTTASRKNRERSFVFGSCRYILRLFGGLWTDSRGDKTFGSILKQIEIKGIRTDSFLMLGDQIYADDLNILHADETVNEYNTRYRLAFSQPNIQKLMSQVPTYMTLDDHEIEDNWPADSSSQDWARKYPAAIHAYQTYQMSHSPIFEIQGDRIVGTPDRFWYTFHDGCSDFFVTDTRTERYLAKNQAERQIIGDEQMVALKSWLNDGSGRVKFMASSVPVFPETKMSSGDKWAGFPTQQSELLDFIWQHQIPRVVMLSGDVHSSFTAELIKKNDASDFKVISVVSSPYYWPYPHNPRRAFSLHGEIESTLSDNVYQVVNPGKVYATDNFTRITVSLRRMKVQSFGRKGNLLGSRTYSF
jgi:alkaline phosphatase D